MSLILNIDTALEKASVSLANNGEILACTYNGEQKDHAAWLHQSVEIILHQSGYSITDINAVSVSIGPGSYTGLRVGLSAAKGYCYALNIPLITVGTLDIMAKSVVSQATKLICPLIDARRMEVYTALYNKDGEAMSPPQALIINEHSFKEHLQSGTVLFCGSGSSKLQKILPPSANALFLDCGDMADPLAFTAFQNFKAGNLADLAYAEPLYIKEFYTTAERS